MRDLAQRAGELRLHEPVACLVEVAVALEDAARGRELREVMRVQRAGFFVAEDKTFSGEANGRSHNAAQPEPPEVALGVDEARDRAGNAGGLWAVGRHPRDDVAVRIEIHVGARGGRRLLAEVEEVRFGGFQATGACGRAGADEHEAASADVAGRRKRDGQREADGNRGVHGIATGAQDLDAGVGRVVLNGDDHRVLRAHGRCWRDRRSGSGLRCLGERADGEESECSGGEEFHYVQ